MSLQVHLHRRQRHWVFECIKNPHGISLDITDNFICNVLADYWKDRKAPCTSSPFPLKPSFEQDLFFAPPVIGSDLKGSTDSDLARDLRDTLSTTSNLITINNVATHWKIAKQPEPTNVTSNTELMSLLSKLLEIKKVRKFITSIGYLISDPTIIYEDNQ
eukprot:1982951-Ditylum_brightwellii.AAC.1